MAREIQTPVMVFPIGETLSPGVAITKAPKQFVLSMDATGYVVGAIIDITIQYQLDSQSPWVTKGPSAKITERGQALDGSPALVWQVGVNLAQGFPTTGRVRLAVNVQGSPITSQLTLSAQ